MFSRMMSLVASSMASRDSKWQLPHLDQDQVFHHSAMGPEQSLAQLGRLWELLAGMSGIPGSATGEAFELRWGNYVKTPAVECEDTEGNASDVLLPDTEAVHPGPQARHQEDVDVAQVGEARQTRLCVVLAGRAGTRVHRTASRPSA